jgi:hypothetical protein
MARTSSDQAGWSAISRASLWSSFSLLIVIAGCKSVEPASPSLKAIEIKQQHRVDAGVNAIVLPAGLYQPDFTTKHGVYYRARNPLRTSGIGLDTTERGGLYLPNSSDSDHRQGVWIDRHEISTSFAVQSPEQVLRFEQHIPFDVVTNSPAGAVK